MINLKNKKHKTINKVVWVWTAYFHNGVCDHETPKELTTYLNDGYTIKDFSTITYRENTGPCCMFILEKTID